MSWNDYNGSNAYRDWLHERIWARVHNPSEYEPTSANEWNEHIQGTDLEDEYDAACFAYDLLISRDLECVLDCKPRRITELQP